MPPPQPMENMRLGSFAADGSIDGVVPDQRLTLILSLFRLHRIALPETVILSRLVDEVRLAELREGSHSAGSTADLLLARRITLCDAAVRRFMTGGA